VRAPKSAFSHLSAAAPSLLRRYTQLDGVSAQYYKDVLLRRVLPPLALAFLASALACNRGAHPHYIWKPAPDFTVGDGTTSIHLAGYRGKVVLLNFWASWCAPCIAELPSLEQLHHDEPALAILAVSIDEDPDSYKSFLLQRHVDLTTVRDPDQSAAQLFRTKKWPETYIIDRSGIIRRKFVGATDWSDPEIRAFLKTL
jgi:cytochrome c biogenesis protein CcmG, thiol:disulfide interchange protein DsbE